MNKHRAHHYYRYTKHFRWQYLLAAAGIAAIVSLMGLRYNSQHMSDLRDQVFTADKQNGDVKAALQELQYFVVRHMNTDLTTGDTTVYPPIQLQYTYERLLRAQQSQTGSGDDLYTQAQAYCQAQNSTDYSGRNRVPCIEQYVQSRGSTVVLSQPIDDSLYKFDFASPSWSPDTAGWGIVAGVALTIAAAVKLATDTWFKRHA